MALLGWPNVAPGDVFEPGGGGLVRVVDVVHASVRFVVGAIVKVAALL